MHVGDYSGNFRSRSIPITEVQHHPTSLVDDKRFSRFWVVDDEFIVELGDGEVSSALGLPQIDIVE